MMTANNYETDVLVVGSGAAGMMAARADQNAARPGGSGRTENRQKMAWQAVFPGRIGDRRFFSPGNYRQYP